jgi:hypothetical protein
MSRASFWQRWLVGVGLVAVFGLFMALLNGTPLFALFNDRIDPVFWGGQAIPAAGQAFRGWVYGVWGATVAGWGILVAFIAVYPFKQRECWAWNALAVAVGAWYLLDTGLSLYFGVIFNVFFNTLLLVLAGLPLVFTRRAFQS